MDMQCSWMGITLSSPLVLASLTLFSKPNIEQHTAFFRKCIHAGAGAIILPSVNPVHPGASNWFVKAMPVDNGLSSRQPMAFTVLGPTSNIASTSYVISLIRTLRKQGVTTPILASVANVGSTEDFLRAIRILDCEDIQGFELNFSCPNVLSAEAAPLRPSADLLGKVRQLASRKPITIKLSPNYDFSPLLNELTDEIQGFTLSNANSGLLPPLLNSSTGSFSPFPSTQTWSPTGVYGPHERLLTFHTLYQFMTLQAAAHKRFSVSSVGGYVNPEHAVQALLLGANTVQLSSAILWKGIGSFESFHKFMGDYVQNHGYSNVASLSGSALPFIVPSADEAVSSESSATIMQVGDNCRKCSPCQCCNRMCYAITQDLSGTAPRINPALCSGCGWCKSQCPQGAIYPITTNIQK